VYEPYQEGKSSDPWCRLADLPSFRAGMQGAVIGQRLFVPGGADHIALVPLDTLFVYRAAFDPALQPIPDTEGDPKLCDH
jgi:hypothetical protein